jgi:hypothetical protein
MQRCSAAVLCLVGWRNKVGLGGPVWDHLGSCISSVVNTVVRATGPHGDLINVVSEPYHALSIVIAPLIH